ncbi:inorganic diphosphatase [Aggregicoccus sp. 17bor-14]|nr:MULTISPECIES: inorganic diphosphatase [Myxococcaceae]MBF5043022.1 inorganic diphosphatase [Simulacricoccus sp. 17bor-14]MRI88786.1 inorganic diphosphatase [Aggregicoccus sp. 17bor-14]
MDFTGLPTYGKGGSVHVVVESPRGSTVKLKFEPKLGAFTVARPLVLGLRYPYDWGFIPGTRGPDGDPLDALVRWDVSSYPGVVLPCRAVGLLKVEQRAKGGGRERNDRLLCVPVAAPRDEQILRLQDVSRRELDEIAHFFLAVVALANKDAEVLGWEGAKAAGALVAESRRP